MKKITSLLCTGAMLLGMAIPQSLFATQADVTTMLTNGGIFRIKNRGSGRFMTETLANHQLKGETKVTQADSLRQMWYVKPMGSGSFQLRNAYTGRYVNNADGQPMVTVSGTKTHYIKYSAANDAGKTTSFVSISWTADYSGNTSLNENYGTHYVLGWKANSSSVNDKFSDWELEAVSGVTLDMVKQQVATYNQAAAAAEGTYFRIINAAYGTAMSESAHKLNCLPNDEADYTQVWQLVKTTSGKWQIKNAVTDYIVAQQGGAFSTQYSTVKSTSAAFTLNDGIDELLLDYAFTDANGVGLHCDAQAKVVGWYTPMSESNWVLKVATVDPTELNRQRNKVAEQAFFTFSNTLAVRRTLRNYFKDDLCLELKDELQSKTDEELTTMMSQSSSTYNTVALPASVQEFVLKMKHGVWGAWEKEFRVFSYNAYSNPNVWNDINHIYTGYAFSPQTNPTGVSVKRGDGLMVFVGAKIPSGTTLKLMVTKGQDVTGTETPLQQGFNYVSVGDAGHAFINYTITSDQGKLADFAALPIHIEGGYVNGCFDITRGHKNADWVQMRADGLLTDEVVHLKSKHIQFNMLLEGTLQSNPASQFTEIDTDGTPKAIEGALMRWDQLIEWERAVMNIEQYEPYFNCMFSASSSSTGNPYASTYGTYYPGVSGLMDYNQMTFGSENYEGGNYWMIGHENGHLHQAAINLAGDTEVSVNFFSQMCTWLQGSNVGRGRPWSNTAADFHANKFYVEYDIWQRSRMYFQLWLYYDYLGHNPGFYKRLFTKLRQDPLERSTDPSNPYSGTRNFLKFAKYASDAAGEDLSEFFQFYGFFKPIENYMVGDYSNSYFTTTQADIDAAIAYMKRHTKANKSIMFIDERIKRSPANYPGMPAGQMRFGTSADATPGVASEVGNVGMYSDFVDNPTYRPYTVNVSSMGVVKVASASGEGAVGFKVYDREGNFVYASNTYTFTIPEKYRTAGYYLTVALGDGTQRVMYDPDNVTGIEAVEAEKAKTAEEKAYDLSGRRVKTGEQKGVFIIDGKRVIR